MTGSLLSKIDAAKRLEIVNRIAAVDRDMVNDTPC